MSFVPYPVHHESSVTSASLMSSSVCGERAAPHLPSSGLAGTYHWQLLPVPASAGDFMACPSPGVCEWGGNPLAWPKPGRACSCPISLPPAPGQWLLLLCPPAHPLATFGNLGWSVLWDPMPPRA